MTLVEENQFHVLLSEAGFYLTARNTSVVWVNSFLGLLEFEDLEIYLHQTTLPLTFIFVA